MSEGNTSGNVVRFGPSTVEFARLDKINVLDQVRTSMNSEALDELAQSILKAPIDEIDSDNVTSEMFDLTTPVSLGRHGLKSAQLFINDHGNFYQIPKRERAEPTDLARLDDGRILIANFGHRRRMASYRISEWLHIPPARIELAASIHNDISFDDALELQTRENIYEKPPVQDEAKLIGRLYQSLLLQHPGSPPSIKGMARTLGYSETKIRDALAFDALPERIKSFAADNVLSFTILKQLKPLMDAFDRKYMSMPANARSSVVSDELVIFCKQMVEMELSGNMDKRRAQKIENKIQELRNSAEYQQLEFLLIAEDEPQLRRQSTGRSLSRLALNVVRNDLRNGDISEEALADIEDLLALHRKRAADAFTPQLDLHT